LNNGLTIKAVAQGETVLHFDWIDRTVKEALMLSISKESLAPRLYEGRREFHRRNSQGRVPELVFCLFLCKAIRKQIRIEEITGQAILTHPDYFHTWVNDDHVPDMALVMLTLQEAAGEKLAVGNWHEGWRLTRRGQKMARDIDRRRLISSSSH